MFALWPIKDNPANQMASFFSQFIVFFLPAFFNSCDFDKCPRNWVPGPVLNQPRWPAICRLSHIIFIDSGFSKCFLIPRSLFLRPFTISLLSLVILPHVFPSCFHFSFCLTFLLLHFPSFLPCKVVYRHGVYAFHSSIPSFSPSFLCNNFVQTVLFC